ncbi:MAG TPA: heme biosynthesis HemY N-terminal domain-containing protein [Stellaceae bacterium]|nr:heme biosynthesis HemY N-terminal domain-containing protein [Stellaceae bacterium]
MRGWIAAVAIALLAVAAAFLADHPGSVEIVWRSWQVETSVAVLAAAIILATLIVMALVKGAALIVRGPGLYLRRRREKRREAGYRALTQGMVAVAAGDPQEAKRYARKAEILLAEPPLTLLLSAQAAQLEGDEAAARKFFTAMLGRGETEFLGLRGLINQALRAGDRGTALRLAERARTLRPNTGWVVESLLDLQLRAGRWEAARETLARAEKLRLLSAERARHRRGVIVHELSLAAARGGDRRRAVRLAAEAQALVSDLAAPAVHYARLVLADGRKRLAARAVEHAWRQAPQPELARLYGEIFGDEPPLSRLKCFERLAEENPGARETHMALAEAALEASLWGEARRHLEAALAAPPPRAELAHKTAPGTEAEEPPPGSPTARLCLMMARLEEAEHGSDGQTREWLDRVAGALPEPRYICAECGAESLEWHSLCPSCGAFDTLSWRTPGGAPPAGLLPLPAAAIKALRSAPEPPLAALPAAAGE